MKRILLILTVLALALCMAAGCAQKDADVGLGLQGDGGFVADEPQQEAGNEQQEQTSDSPTTETQKPSGGNSETQTPQAGNNTNDSKDESAGQQQVSSADQPQKEEQQDSSADQPQKEEQEQVKEYPWIKVCSYNVKQLYYDYSNNANGVPLSKLDAVCAELRKINADIVGLQELGRFSESAGGTDKDQLKLMADKLGYSYYYFTKTDNLSGGISEYGHGILSRYPIKSSEDHPFYLYYVDGTNEKRAFSRHIIEIEGKELVFYNTHLAEKIVDQFDVITKMMAEDKANGRYAVLTGDMNIDPANLNPKTNGCIMLNTVENPQRTSVPDGWLFPPCDNIVVTENLEYWWDAAKKTGITVVNSTASDHKPIYTQIRFK